MVQAATGQNLGELGTLLADTVGGYLQIERRYVDWLTTAEAGLRAAVQRRDRYATSVMRLGLGLAYQGMNRLTEASEQIEQALAGFRVGRHRAEVLPGVPTAARF